MSDAFATDDARRSWGRVVRARHYIAKPRFPDTLEADLRQAAEAQRKLLAVGLGRSYGDSNLNPDAALLDMTGLDRIIAFDAERGVLRADAGMSLADALRFAVPRGWFLATTPGTRFVTLGGAVANDVHGKNHHSAGAFGCAVRRIGLVRSDRGALELGPDAEVELFEATIGGLGLTGVITWVELQLVRIPSAFIEQETIAFDDLDGFFAIAEDSQGRYEHTAAWIDCTARGASLGRGIFTHGNWAPEGGFRPHADKLAFTIPIDGTALAFNPLSLKLFNGAVRAAQRLDLKHKRVHYASHLFPLDSIGAWNRLYGKRGFYQYQCVLPSAAARDGVSELLSTITKSGLGSMLVVLKTLGPKRSPGLLSFPMEGATLAMDFPNAGARTLSLFSQLDAIVHTAGGRLYPAKDGRIPASMFQSGYPQWSRFEPLVDPALSSRFWQRVSQ